MTNYKWKLLRTRLKKLLSFLFSRGTFFFLPKQGSFVLLLPFGPHAVEKKEKKNHSRDENSFFLETLTFNNGIFISHT